MPGIQEEWNAEVPGTRPATGEAVAESTRRELMEDRSTTDAPDPFADVFAERDTLDRIVSVWRSRRNIVLQGAPGVGKSFVAGRLAKALIGGDIEQTVMRVQFHPSTAYEDFVQGYRLNGSGGFALRDGPFVRFCRTATARRSVPHVLIIDEFNRGNLGRILGELMVLIEPDKRGREYEMPLVYAVEGTPHFHVPDNVFLLGLMNTADRSLAMIDYALRRRFAFFTLRPAFSSTAFEQELLRKRVTAEMVSRIRTKMEDLNRAIEETQALGRGFVVGHSFFTDGPAAAEREEDWYTRVVETEILPLLEQYWFDSQETVDSWRKKLTDWD